MKDLVLITNQYPYLAGETFLENEIEYLSDKFDKVYIFSVNAPNEAEKTRKCPHNVYSFPIGESKAILKNIKSIFLGFSRKKDGFTISAIKPINVIASFYCRGRARLAAKKILKILTDSNINLKDVTIYSYWFTYQAIAAVFVANSLKDRQNRNARIIARAHGYDLYWERVMGNYLPFQDKLLNSLDFCFPCSEFGKDYLEKKYPWAANKIIVSRLGTMDSGIGKYSGEKILVTCSTLEPLKRMSLFAKAFSKLIHLIPDVKWVCIGDGKEAELIKDILKKENALDHVHMLGRISNSDVIEYYKTNPVMYFCNISTTEGVPVSIMEALSFGIPVFATCAGGTGELVNNDNGKLIPVDIDEDYLANELKKMIEIPGKQYLQMRLNARFTWENKSSAKKNYAEFISSIQR